jgi:hypothetical protein
MLIPVLLSLTFGTFTPQNGRSQTAAPAAWPVASIASRCPKFEGYFGAVEVASCRVTKSGMFASFQGDTYYYALYCVVEAGDKGGSCPEQDSKYGNFYSDDSIAVFVQRGGSRTVRLLFSKYALGGHFTDSPGIDESSDGAVMEVPYVAAPTCNCNGSTYYLWRPQAREWVAMDWDSWHGELKLPTGLSTSGGGYFWPRLQSLTADSPLWRSDDPRCCPTGGTVYVQLGIVGTRFVLRSFRVELAESPR